jgi:DNA invertase Pin-like site-specific DNA recombinase
MPHANRLCTDIDHRPSSRHPGAGTDLLEIGCGKLFVEQVSSVGTRRQLEAALDYVREGDTLVVTKLDRLARSVADLLNIIGRLEAKKVALRVLSMSGTQTLDTSTAVGKLMLAVIGAVGQFEREMMLERQRAGIAKAKAQGRYKGRVPTAQRQASEIIRLKSEGVRPSEIARKLGMGRASVYRVLGDRRVSGQEAPEAHAQTGSMQLGSQISHHRFGGGF